jgi:hypothetical protein
MTSIHPFVGLSLGDRLLRGDSPHRQTKSANDQSRSTTLSLSTGLPGGLSKQKRAASERVVQGVEATPLYWRRWVKVARGLAASKEPHATTHEPEPKLPTWTGIRLVIGLDRSDQKVDLCQKAGPRGVIRSLRWWGKWPGPSSRFQGIGVSEQPTRAARLSKTSCRAGASPALTATSERRFISTARMRLRPWQVTPGGAPGLQPFSVFSDFSSPGRYFSSPPCDSSSDHGDSSSDRSDSSSDHVLSSSDSVHHASFQVIYAPFNVLYASYCVMYA